MAKTVLIKSITGAGKSTLMWRLKKELHIDNEHLYVSDTNKKYYYYDNGNHIYLLGRYQEGRHFCGLDTYSEKFRSVELIEKIKSEDPEAVIYCEGTFVKKYDYDINLYLQVSMDVLIENLKNRAKTNNTKLSKKNTMSTTTDDNVIKEKLEAWQGFERRHIKQGFTMLQHNTDEERESNFQLLLSYAK